MNEILFTQLNDFIFCPASIYFHSLYGNNTDRVAYQTTYQINGTAAHKTIDENHYSSRKNILQGIEVYCEKYNLVGKIDLFDIEKGKLTERKRTVKKIYDGYVFQLYAQYYSLIEMGYAVNKMQIHSITDNKNYEIELPVKNMEMNLKFEKLISDIRQFDLNGFKQDNVEKCHNCIYEPACFCTGLNR